MDDFTLRWTTRASVALWIFLLIAMLFQTLGGTPVTFGTHINIHGRVEYEYPLGILLWNTLLLVVLITARILALALFSRDGIGTWAGALSFSLEMCGLIGLVGQGVTLGLWMAVANHPAGTHYWPPIVFLVLSGLAWYLGRSSYTFGLIDSSSADRRQESVSHAGPRVDSDGPQLEVARKQTPHKTFASIYGNENIKRRLREAGHAIIADRAPGKEARNGILLLGEPGNGKTIFAEALAGELKLPLITLSYTDVEHHHVGVKTERVKATFEQAIRHQPCVLFIDEVDSFISSRTLEITQIKEDVDLVNGLLTLLVDIRKHKVLVMAATNHLDRLDSAAMREGRFDFKIEITPPDEPARLGLLQAGLAANLPRVRVDPQTVACVAKRWNGYSVKRILAVTEELPAYLADRQGQGDSQAELSYDDFMAALRRLQGRSAAASLPEHVKPLAELRLPAVTREAIDMVARRLRDPVRLERLGGTLPTGLLFYGPPGTGKTSAAMALAKEAGWSFLHSTGAELARNVKTLETLAAKARELRPAIILIDEADALLRSRDLSPNPDAKDKLLSLMDGAEARIKDLLWVAATNHPQEIDSALLRGGRFTEKIEFQRPDESQLAAHLTNWLGQRQVRLAPEVKLADVAALLAGQSIANAEAVLQSALNQAITRSDTDEVVVSHSDLQQAVSTVLGA